MSQILEKIGQLKKITQLNLTTKTNNDGAKKIITDIETMNPHKIILEQIKYIKHDLSSPPCNRELWIKTINSRINICIKTANKINNKNHEKKERPYTDQIKKIKSRVCFNGIIYYSQDYLLNTLHMPINYLLKCSKINLIEKDSNKYYKEDYINNEILNKKQHPHLIDVQKEKGYYDNVYVKDHVKKKEIDMLHRIIKAVGKYGEYQHIVDIGGKKYILDYMYEHNGDPFIKIEINEKHHERTKNILNDNMRNNELIGMYGPLLYHFPVNISNDDFEQQIEMIKQCLNYAKKETMQLENIIEQCSNLYDDKLFAKMFKIELLNEKNDPFQFPIKKVKKHLDIEPDSDKDKEINELFSTNESFNNESDNSPDNSEYNSEDQWDDDDDIQNVSDNDNIQSEHITIYKENKDFVIRNGEIIITRKLFMRIAVMGRSMMGDRIFNILYEFGERLTNEIKQNYEMFKNYHESIPRKILYNARVDSLQNQYKSKEDELTRQLNKERMEKGMVLHNNRDLQKQLDELKERS
ncbi:MAG: hypothetical protein Terrestrivirus8_36 [Terrestrivirus sp.]|uniref:Uncharacterized protein n=1 Tax=Terrestrivirus sp. TaxID=2487775 RepID=A0A3G4ZSH0_9VIRU|nr:MAG: hypothetical protein Terrestrivirus8_36 [Terrestrivirus sp.]